jgi:hypothetical protein
MGALARLSSPGRFAGPGADFLATFAVTRRSIMPNPLDEYKKEEKEINKEQAQSQKAAAAAKTALDKLNKLSSFSNKVKKELSAEPD